MRFFSTVPLAVALCLAIHGTAQTPSSIVANALNTPHAPASAVRAAANSAAINTPLSFEVNAGQTDSRVRYLTRGNGYTVYFTNQDAVFALSGPAGDAGALRSSFFRMKFVGASASAPISGTDRQQGESNYLIGNDPKQWRTHIGNYAKVEYSDLYPGVSSTYYGNGHGLEYDLTVKPGASVGQIAIAIDGVRNLRVDSAGDVQFFCGGRNISMQKPNIYQNSADGKRIEVAGSWQLKSGGRLTFSVPKYDHSRELIIDPSLAGLGPPFAVYIGGSGTDIGYKVAVDPTGAFYVAGSTNSQGFPASSGSLQPTDPDYNINYTPPGTSAFVVKYNANGTRAYSTYLGGATDLQNPTLPSGLTNSNALGIAVNSSGNAYITGTTNAHGSFPTQPTQSGCVTLNSQILCNFAYVVELSTTGSSEVYGEFIQSDLGGSAIALDSSGDAYVTGAISSTYVNSSSNGFQTTSGGGEDAYVTKLTPTGGFSWWTFLGGAGTDNGTGIALDNSGNVYVTGTTTSSGTFPTKNPLQSAYGGGTSDAFVTEMNNSGTQVIYSTYLGGSGTDQGYAIAVDPTSGAAFVTGTTQSPNFPTANPLQGAFGGAQNAYIAQIAPDGANLVYSTYLGGSLPESGTGIAVDGSDNAYVVGQIDTPAQTVSLGSSQFQTIGAIDPNLLNLATNSLQPQCGSTSPCSNAFVTEINPTGNEFVFFTYLGGSGSDQANGLALDNSSACANTLTAFWNSVGGSSQQSPIGPPCIYVTGSASSTDFPVSVPQYTLGHSNAGGVDAFIALIPSLAVPACTPTLSQAGLKATVSILCTKNFDGGAGNVNWGDGQTPGGLSLQGLNNSSAPVSHIYAHATSVVPSVSMTNTETTGVTYATPFPVTQLAPIAVTLCAPGSPTAQCVPATPTLAASVIAPNSIQIPASVTNATVSTVKMTTNVGTMTPCTSFTSPIGPFNQVQVTDCAVYTPPANVNTTLTNITINATSISDGLTTTTTPLTLTVYPPLTVTLNPLTKTLQAGSPSFPVSAALPSYSSSQNVTWQLSGTGCSGAPCGTISTQGPSTSTTYTPPATLPSSASAVDTLTATSVVQSGITSQLAITINPLPITMTINPTSAIAIVTQSPAVQFSAAVTGPANTAVTWTLSGTGCAGNPCGKLSASGLYTPPSAALSSSTGSATDTVTATSQAVPSKSVSAAVALYNPATVTLTPASNTVLAASGSFPINAQLTPYAASQNVTWALTGTGCNGSPCGSLSSSGPSTATTYVPPAKLPSSVSVTDTVTATSVSEPSQMGQSVITVTPLTVGVSVSPSTLVAIASLSAPVQFAATVTGPSNTAVKWTLSGTSCASAPCGTLSASGLYTPPGAKMANATATDTITATSQADATRLASVQITLYNPVTVSFTPAAPVVQAGSGAISITTQLTPYASSQNVTWALTGPGCVGSPSGSISTIGPGTSTLYTPPARLPGAANVTDCLIATAVSEPSQTGQLNLTITPLPVSVAISPTATTVLASQSKPIQFTATVTGPSNTSITWTVSGTGCGNAACGSINSSGIYTPPAAPIPSPGSIDAVIATSQADPTKNASAAVTIINPVAVSIAPPGVSGEFSIEVGKSQAFVAVVTGSTNTAVSWSVSGAGCNGGPCGTITSAGTYSAPPKVASAQFDTITATSAADGTKFATIKAAVFAPAVASSPTAQTVTAGQSASFNVTLNGGTGDPLNPVGLTCSNLPNGAKCQFTPSAIAPGSTTFSVQVTTTSQSLASIDINKTVLWASFVPFGILLIGARYRRLRKTILRYSIFVALCILIGGGLTACSTNGSFGTNELPNPAATPAGSFSINVIGQSQVPSGQIQPGATMVTSLPLTVN